MLITVSSSVTRYQLSHTAIISYRIRYANIYHQNIKYIHGPITGGAKWPDQTNIWMYHGCSLQRQSRLHFCKIHHEITYSKCGCNLLFISRRCAPAALLLGGLEYLVVSSFHDKVSTRMRGRRTRITIAPLWRRRRLWTLTRRARSTAGQTVIAWRTGTSWRRLRTAVITGPMSCW